ncbi:MAG: hypothetical protein ACRD2O_05425 [Terriglobia bacterium]
MPIDGRNTEVLSPFQPVKGARVVSGYELGVALILLLFGAAPIIAGWVFLWHSKSGVSDWIVVNVVGIFAFAVVETFAVILLWGFGRVSLPESFARWLGGATIGEVATMLILLIEHFFPR